MFSGAPRQSRVPGGPPEVGDFTEFDEDALVRMAQRFESTEDYGSAMRMYGQALEKNSSSVPALLGIARIYAAGGVTQQAEAYFRRVLAIEPGNPDAGAGLAGQLILADRGADAIRFLEGFVDAGNESARLYNVLGVAHDLVGEHENAQLAYSQGLDLAPGSPDILNNMALSFAIGGAYDTAIALLQEQINNPAQRSVARQNLALVYALSGDLDSAEGIAATELSPQDVAVNRVFYARLAELSSSDRARAVYLRRLPSAEDQERQQQAMAMDETGSAVPNATMSDEPDASQELPATEEAAPPRPLTAAERAAAIIRARQSPDQEPTDLPADEVDAPVQQKTEQAVSETGDAVSTMEDEIMAAEDSIATKETVVQSPAPPEVADATDDSALDELFAAEVTTPQEASDGDFEDVTQTEEAVPEPEVTAADAAADMTEFEGEAATAESAVLPDPAEAGEILTADAAESTDALELRYWIQVGSYRDRDTARTGWNGLVGQHEELLDGFSPQVQEFTDDDGTLYYRLFAAGFPGFTAATERCANFLADGIGCFVIDATESISPLDEMP